MGQVLSSFTHSSTTTAAPPTIADGAKAKKRPLDTIIDPECRPPTAKRRKLGESAEEHAEHTVGAIIAATTTAAAVARPAPEDEQGEEMKAEFTPSIQENYPALMIKAEANSQSSADYAFYPAANEYKLVDFIYIDEKKRITSSGITVSVLAKSTRDEGAPVIINIGTVGPMVDDTMLQLERLLALLRLPIPCGNWPRLRKFFRALCWLGGDHVAYEIAFGTLDPHWEFLDFSIEENHNFGDDRNCVIYELTLRFIRSNRTPATASRRTDNQIYVSWGDLLAAIRDFDIPLPERQTKDAKFGW